METEITEEERRELAAEMRREMAQRRADVRRVPGITRQQFAHLMRPRSGAKERARKEGRA